MDNKTFVRITNGDIYEKVCEIEKHVIITNGKVKINRWIATTAITLVIVLMGIILSPSASALTMSTMIIGGNL